MTKIPVESQNNNKEEFSYKEIIAPEKAETLKKLYQSKEFAQIQKPPKVSSKIIIISIIVSIIFGFLAGFFGALYLLSRKEIKIPFFKKINFEEILPKREITLFTEKNITVLPEERISNVIDQISPQIVQVFFSKKIDKTKEIVNGFVLPEENLTLAVILTSDGWLATSKGAISQSNLNLEILTSEKKRFSVKKIIFDDLSNTVFLKIEAKDLPVVKFAEKNSLSFGKNLLFFDKFFNFDLAQISQPNFFSEERKYIHSTEKFSNFIKINKELSKNYLSSPVFDLDGSFVGFVSSLDEILLASHFQPVINSLFKEGKIKRPFLGLEYINLDDFLISPSFLENVTGAFVYNVKEKSPAFLGGFKKGDLILKINNLPLEKSKNLTEIVQELKPNEEVNFLILREGKETTLKVKLGSL